MSYLLLILILLPVAAAIAILGGAPAKRTALAASAIGLLLSLVLAVAYDRGSGGFQFLLAWPIIPELKVNFALGVDGLSMLLILLTTIVTLAAVSVAPAIEKSERAYYAGLLFIAAGALGAFAATDIVFFYIFHELALIPTFLLIGIWGHGDKRSAAWKITIYLALGSIVLLVGLLALYYGQQQGMRTFSMPELLAMPGQVIPAGEQGPIFLMLLIGFGILVSLFPFHTWAPTAYACAPTPVAMLHAGILKKFGLYGLLRLAVPLLPEGAEQYLNILLILLVCNIVYVGFVTIAQKSLDYMLGYSSVMHMGYAFLGIAAMNEIGATGTSLMLFAHGLTIAALFAICGEIKRTTATLEFTELGGLAKQAPLLGLLFGAAAFASIGLPGFIGFPAELLIFFGAFNTEVAGATLNNTQLATILALTGLVLSAIYMLRAYQSIFMGETADRCSSVYNTPAAVKLPVAGMLAALLVTGFYPALLTDLLVQPIELMLAAIN